VTVRTALVLCHGLGIQFAARFLTGRGYAADPLVGALPGGRRPRAAGAGGGRGRGCAAEESLGLTISGFLTPHARRLRLRWNTRRRWRWRCFPWERAWWWELRAFPAELG
jgi:hypothetical protein